MLDAVPPTRTPAGRRRKRPRKPHADKGYDDRRCRAACRKRAIASRIARIGMEAEGRLGRHRRVPERTLAWLKRHRRRADLCHVLLTLACCVVCLHSLTQEL